jgi:valyl-tRNA synthetase
MAKSRLYDEANPEGKATAAAVLWSVLDRTVRLLHPYMPFLTEEIWQHLRRAGSPAARELSGWKGSLPESVMVAPWPQSGAPDEEAEREIALVVDLVRQVRTVRSEYKVDPGKYISATVAAGPSLPAVERGAETMRRLARLQPLAIHEVVSVKPARAVALLVGEVTVYLPLDELTDVEAERERLRKELNSAVQQRDAVGAKLKNQSFTLRAPEAVVAREREKAQALGERIRRLEERLEILDT